MESKQKISGQFQIGFIGAGVSLVMLIASPIASYYTAQNATTREINQVKTDTAVLKVTVEDTRDDVKEIKDDLKDLKTYFNVK